MEPQHWEILQPFLEERRIQWTLLTARMQTADFQIPGGTVIRPYFTRHIDKAFWNMPHGCYLISFGEKHVLLTADVDYTIETFEQISCVHINAAFVNPLFFNALRTGTFLRAHCSQIFSASIISLFRRMTGGKFARCYRTICTGGIKSKGRLPSWVGRTNMRNFSGRSEHYESSGILLGNGFSEPIRIRPNAPRGGRLSNPLAEWQYHRHRAKSK